MENNYSFLNSLNPVVKLILIIIPTLVVSFAYDIYTPTMFFLLILVLASIFGQINVFALLKSMIKFIFVGISFSSFIIVTRAFTSEGLTQEVIITATSLCLRIIVFSLTSIIFVKTTDPNEFGLSLIHQLKLSYKIVYPFLIAYRFVPTFQNELEKIILAKEVRGISLKKGVLSNILNLHIYILPLLASAVRKGERVSISMESRGFGVYDNRTYYRSTSIKAIDYKALVFFTIISIAIIWFGIYHELIVFKLGLVIK